ncbi:MAG TPA: translation elongation factor Ts [Xanthobacteraceae bacterium]|jgi:elongation factor Ts
MANITAQMVKELRERTGAGMMDCKAALAASDGNMEAGVDWLRKKGLAKAATKAGRITADGLIGIAVTASKGAIVEVNSETDFVARNEFFQGLVKMIADVALTAGPDVEEIKNARIGNGTVADAIAESIAKIGENMTLRRAALLAVGQGVIGTYMHNAVAEDLGKIGVLVAMESAADAEEIARFGRKVAMHIAASNPLALDSSHLDPDLIRREKEVLSEKAKAQGKPPNVIDKIVESGLKTFYKEVCLVDQPFVHEPDKSVAQAVKEAEGRLGAPVKITGYVRYALGEGVEREKKDFAAEVAAAAGPR